MNMESYTIRRNELLWQIGLMSCAHCVGNGIINSENLEIHHVNGNGHSHGIGGTMQLIKLEKDWKDYQNGNKENELIVLCHEHHIQADRKLGSFR
jgi:hypothetical protein